MGKPVSAWPIKEFKSIPNQHFPILPNKAINVISTDQYYAYRICWAVILGEIDSDLSLFVVGPVVHSQWLTLECHILCLYTSIRHLHKALLSWLNFALCFCFPSWFEINHKSNLSNGSNYFFNMVKRVQRFSHGQVQKIVMKVLQKNVYIAHTENLVLGIFCDEDKGVHRIAVNKIQCIRKIFIINVIS